MSLSERIDELSDEQAKELLLRLLVRFAFVRSTDAEYEYQRLLKPFDRDYVRQEVTS